MVNQKQDLKTLFVTDEGLLNNCDTYDFRHLLDTSSYFPYYSVVEACKKNDIQDCPCKKLPSGFTTLLKIWDPSSGSKLIPLEELYGILFIQLDL